MSTPHLSVTDSKTSSIPTVASTDTVVINKQLKPNPAAPVAEKIAPPQLDAVLPKKTKIVATLGPASNKVDVLVKLIESGVDVFRLNMSHGKQEEHAQTAANVREAAAKIGRTVGIMADLQGPKFRTGLLEDNKKVMLKTGDVVSVVTSTKRNGVGNSKCLCAGTAHADVMVREVLVGHRIMINDGAVVLRVQKRIASDELLCLVLVGGEVGEKKGMNVPELKVPIPAITDKDAKDALFALSLGVDFIALSFVQRPEDVVMLKTLLEANIKPDPANPKRMPRIPKIISKIEKPQAIDCIDDILAVTDCVMVARGDLGVECSLELVPVYQKLLIEKCNKALVPVITATQMLESMIGSPFPTRAEVSDVANAVYDGTDAVMLSGESAMGAYPCEAVAMMASIVETAERALRQKALAPILAHNSQYHHSHSPYPSPASPSGGAAGVGITSPTMHFTPPPPATPTIAPSATASAASAVTAAHSPAPAPAAPNHHHLHSHHAHMQINLSFPNVDFMHHAMALSAHVAAQGLQAKAIVAICLTYDMACYVSKLRSLCPVLAVTPSPRLFRTFHLNYGLIPVLIPTPKESGSDHFLVEMEKELGQLKAPLKVLAPGDLYIFVSGASPVPGLTHSMQALRFGEAAKLLATGAQWTDHPSKKHL